MRINNLNNNLNFKGLDKPLNQFYDKNATIPTLLIETGVTLGRTHEANKEMGKKEAVERFVEQGTSALIWIYGVQFLQKTVEKIANLFFDNADFNFDVGFDSLRNPIENCNIPKKLANFKIINMISTTMFAAYFIGYILPKINHKISSKFKNNDEKDNSMVKAPGFEQFQKNTKKSQNLSFKGGLNDFAHILENNSTARLFITDLGVVSGRYENGRNKTEKIGGLFRDIASIYFYLRATNDIVGLLNKFSLTKSTNIDPKAQNAILDLINEKISEGATKDDIIKNLAKPIDEIDKTNIDGIFLNKRNKIMSADDFSNYFPHLKDKILNMAHLQPVFDNKEIISQKQAYDALNTSWLSDPKFLKETFNKITNGKSDDPKRFVSRKFLESQRDTFDEFSSKLTKFLQENENINQDNLFSEIQKYAKKNTRNNFINYAIGTLLSMVALGIIIPKVQYYIMQKIDKRSQNAKDVK